MNFYTLFFSFLERENERERKKNKDLDFAC